MSLWGRHPLLFALFFSPLPFNLIFLITYPSPPLIPQPCSLRPLICSIPSYLPLSIFPKTYSISPPVIRFLSSLIIFSYPYTLIHVSAVLSPLFPFPSCHSYLYTSFLSPRLSNLIHLSSCMFPHPSSLIRLPSHLSSHPCPSSLSPRPFHLISLHPWPLSLSLHSSPNHSPLTPSPSLLSRYLMLLSLSSPHVSESSCIDSMMRDSSRCYMNTSYS